jgi:quercetin dioxygenase-like cupin family protein
MVGVVVLAASTVVSVTAQSPEEPAPGEARAGVVFTYPLESPAGQQVTGVLVEYGPGGASRPHHHTMRGSVVAYVLEGAVRSRVNGGPVTVYEVGESWVEPPGAAHSVSENASSTEPARVLAVFVAEVGAELTTFDP